MTAVAKVAAAKPVAQREITITRTFDAPRALVFSMFTDAKHLAAWWGPHGLTNPRAEADPRPGGKILIHMQAPDGTVHPMGGIFDEIVPHERIVFTTFVDMPDGKRVLEAHNTVTFAGRRPQDQGHGARACGRLYGLLREHARRHGGRLVAEPRQALRACGARDRREGCRRSGGDPRHLRRPHQRAVRQGRRSRGEAFRRRRRVLRSRSAAAACRPGPRGDAGLVRHLGRSDRVGDDRYARSRSTAISPSRAGLAT